MADPETTLEQRVNNLEQQVAQVLDRMAAPNGGKSWRSSLGLFTDDPVMKEIDEEGRKIREAERQEARRDHS